MTQALQSPRGRLDLLVLRLGEELTRRVLDPAVSRLVKRPGVDLWGNGLDRLTESAVKHARIPARPLTVDDVVKFLAPKKRRLRCIR